MDFLVEPDGLTGFERDHHKTLGAPGGTLFIYAQLINDTQLTDKETKLTTAVMNLN